MTRMSKQLLLLTLLSVALPAAAQVYKYKDESGRTVFSDKPPATPSKPEKAAKSGKPGRDDNLYGAPDEAKPAVAAPIANGVRASVDPELEKRRKEKEAREKAEREKAEMAQAEENKAACAEIRRGIAMLESGQRVASTDEKGERVMLDDEGRAREIGRLKSRLSNCN